MLLKNQPRREYRLKDGTLVPGVTTVLDALAKPALYKWYWEGGFETGYTFAGTDPDKNPKEPTFSEWQSSQKDSTAGVGTIAHYKIQCFLTGRKEEYGPGWAPEHIEMAQVPFERFLRYFEEQRIKPILIEHSVVHEKNRYGGTFDLLADTKKGERLIDLKTSKAIYGENYIQLAAYRDALSDTWRKARSIKHQVVLITKDGRLEAPTVSQAYMNKAKATWIHLIKMYHKLQAFRHNGKF